MRKITAKEFKEILTDSGVNFEIFGFEGILNELTIYNEMMAKKYEGRTPEKAYKNISNKIYEALEKRGYYDDIR